MNCKSAPPSSVNISSSLTTAASIPNAAADATARHDHLQRQRLHCHGNVDTAMESKGGGGLWCWLCCCWMTAAYCRRSLYNSWLSRSSPSSSEVVSIWTAESEIEFRNQNSSIYWFLSRKRRSLAGRKIRICVLPASREEIRWRSWDGRRTI